MTSYWLLFLIPALISISEGHKNHPYGMRSAARLNTVWWVTVVILTLVIGFRLKVGGDWARYIFYVLQAEDRSFLESVNMSDPGYQVLNWISTRLGLGIWGVNLFAGAVFSYGLAIFCRKLPHPWLALTVAVPYTVIVVAMGYTRQGVALGFVMLGIVALGRRDVLRFACLVVLGATFHKSAVLILPIAALASTRNRLWTTAWVGVVGLLAYFLLLAESVETLYVNYVEAEYQSEGAFVRLAMNALPAAILLFKAKRFRFPHNEEALWKWLAIISVVLFLLLFVTPSSTALDRVALYLLPLQMVVFAYLPDVIGRNREIRSFLFIGIITYYGLVQFVWMNFASHAKAWLPYRFYPFELFFL